jgi:hypothetical protein
VLLTTKQVTIRTDRLEQLAISVSQNAEQQDMIQGTLTAAEDILDMGNMSDIKAFLEGQGLSTKGLNRGNLKTYIDDLKGRLIDLQTSGENLDQIAAGLQSLDDAERQIIENQLQLLELRQRLGEDKGIMLEEAQSIRRGQLEEKLKSLAAENAIFAQYYEGMTEEQLTQAHAVLDAKRLTMVNRTVVRLLHDAVYPSNTVESPATTKLRSILKTPEVSKILQGEKLPTESEWAVHPWLMPAVHMYGRLTYKFEGMTDMINGAFMEDLSELLNAATGDQRRRKSFYEIDTEFEKMTASLLKNFNSMASLMPFLRASLRQTMIRKLASVGKDKDGWKKADEHLTTLIVISGNLWRLPMWSSP